MDGKVYALNADDGSLLWSFDAGRPGFSAAALIAGNKVFMAHRSGKLYALDPQTGELAWQYDAEAPFFASPAYDNSVVYAAAEDMAISAIDARTGKRRWQSPKLSHREGPKSARNVRVGE